MIEPVSVPKPVVLCVLDGWGERPPAPDNAIELASIPNWHRFVAESPNALLQTSGLAVGLPDGQMGNSEVGHMNLGAGRVVMQDLPRIDARHRLGRDREYFRLERGDRRVGGKRRGLPPDGADVSGRGSFASGAPCSAGAGVGCAGDSGSGACLPRRAGHAAVVGAGVRQGLRGGGGGLRGRRHRHGDRPLLRDGPRQALGPGGSGLRRDDAGRWRSGADRRPRGGRGLFRRGDRRVRQAPGDRPLCGDGGRRRGA